MTDGTEDLDKAKRKQSPVAKAAKRAATGLYLTDDTATVFWHNETFWQELSEAALASLALGDGCSTRSQRTEFIDGLRASTYVGAHKWGRVDDHEIAFRNGVLDVRTGELRKHRTQDYLERVLPCDYDADAPALVWQKALSDWFGELAGDEGGIVRPLQEFFGYACMSHAKYKKALLVYGPSDSGKSLIGYVLALMVGRDQTCSLPLEQMDDPQARAVIVGKALNLLTEITTSALIADGGFKTLISTEEPVLINAKYKPPFSYYPTAKHLFITNNLPGLSDRTEAVINRLAVIPMPRVFSKSEKDERLPEKLAEEIPGILAWAVQGAKRLVEQRGQFSEAQQSAVVLEELRRKANAVIDFVELRLTPSETAATPISKLLPEFARWKGGKAVTVKALGGMLRSAGKTVKLVHRGKLVATCLVGYELNTEPVPDLFTIAPRDALSDATKIEATAAVDAAPSGDRP